MTETKGGRSPRRTRAQIEREEKAIRVAVTVSVRETLLSMGLNPDNPLMSQATFASLNKMVELFNDPEYQKDMAWIRQRRLDSEKLKEAGVRALVAAVIAGLIAVLVAGYKLLMAAGAAPAGH